MKKQIVHKSAAPLYATAVVWVLYALLFPLYKPVHFAIAIAASALVGVVARLLCKDVVEEVEVPVEPETTGNAELDKMIADCDAAIAEMKRLDDNITDEKISAQIVRLEELTAKIIRQVKAEPAKLPQIRKFMNYYLPTTLKLLNTYVEFEDAGIEGENLKKARERIEATMDSLVKGFDKQLDDLYRSEAMDIDSDIRVMESMLRRDISSVAEDFGLGGTAVQQEPDDE